MRKIPFAFALVLFVGAAQALSVSTPAEVATNTAFLAAIDFDSLGSFSDATIEINGTIAVSLETVGGSKLYVKTVDKSRVLNLKEGETIDGSSIYLLLNSMESAGDRTIRVEENGKDSTEAIVTVFEPATKAFEQEYLTQFTSLKNTIMSYANDIDDLKEKVDALNGLVASNQASNSELQSKLNELSWLLDGMQDELSAKASVEQLQGLQSAVDEQAAKLLEMEEKTDEFTSAGFISFASIQKETALTIIAAIAVIIVLFVVIAKGKVSLPKLPRPSGKPKEESIYRPSKKDEEITSQVLEETSKGEEPQGSGKWAFKKGGWKPKPEKESKRFNISDLIRKD